VAAARPERPEPGTPTPKPEPSVVKSPPRSRSRTCWRRRRAALLLLQQAEPRSSSAGLHRAFHATVPVLHPLLCARFAAAPRHRHLAVMSRNAR
jgi:hypothetical protein